MLLEQKPAVPNYNMAISGDDGSGHIKNVTYKYRPRVTPSQTSDSDDCSIEVLPAYSEGTIARTLFRKFSFMITDEQIARYCNEASRTVMIGRPATSFMAEHMDYLMHSLNGMVGAMDQALLSAMASEFGTNVVTGNANAQTVNIDQDADVNDLTTGFTKLLADAAENELCGNLNIVGSGLMNNFMLQQAVTSAAANGIDTSKFTGYNWYHDIYAGSAWGANQVGVFESGSAFLVDINRFTGFRAGQKGTSFFFSMPVPVECCNGLYRMLNLDVQLKYHDCPSELSVDGYESAITVDRGWQMIVSKSFDLFVPPANYAATDRLTGVNGTLRYAITNT